MIPENFLDFYDIFVNELVGDITLFVFLSLIIIAFIGIRYFRFPFSSVFIFMLLFGSILMVTTHLPYIWVIVVFISGFFFYRMFARFLHRGD